MDRQRRRDVRVAAAYKVRYTTLDQLVIAYTHDLSHGGMFLRTRTLLILGDHVRVHIELPENGGEITVLGRVTHVRSPADAERLGKPAGMGIEFLDLGAEALARIEVFIAQRATRDVESSGPIELKRRLHVLVVDDDDTYRGLAADTFATRGDTVRVAKDGLEGLGACLQGRPDVVLSDVQMPRMDGWQLLRMIRSRPQFAATPVLFLTTLGGDAERLRGYQLGVDDYLAKPYQPEELLVRVDRLLLRSLDAHVRLERRSLRGDLAQVALAAVLSFLEVERKTGLLQVSRERTAQVHIKEGRPLRVELDGQGGTDILHDLLGWTEGEFEFAAGPVDCPDELGTSATALILENARLRDEARR